ncbi:hypothetical protein FGB62_149g017 [Gracilaria domingensis]|nr:hypothetical protein FGB62_149g017 [Gracilaria domingensis]
MEVREHRERGGDGAQSGAAAGFERLVEGRRDGGGALRGRRKAAMDRIPGGGGGGGYACTGKSGCGKSAVGCV